MIVSRDRIRGRANGDPPRRKAGDEAGDATPVLR
jgi:hypothetical protein